MSSLQQYKDGVQDDAAVLPTVTTDSTCSYNGHVLSLHLGLEYDGVLLMEGHVSLERGYIMVYAVAMAVGNRRLHVYSLSRESRICQVH